MKSSTFESATMMTASEEGSRVSGGANSASTNSALSISTDANRVSSCRVMHHPKRSHRVRRRGQATLDYALLMGVVLPLATVCFWFVPQILRSVYEMTCVVWGWPFP